MAKSLTDSDKMPFGKYRGREMRNVPAEYLDWLRDQRWLDDKYPQVAKYIDESELQINQELEEKDVL